MTAHESPRWEAHFWVECRGRARPGHLGLLELHNSESHFLWSVSVNILGGWRFFIKIYIAKFDIRADNSDFFFSFSALYSPTRTTSLCLAPLCLRYGMTSSYVGTSAMSYISLFLHSYMDLLVFLSLLLRRKLLLNPAGGQDKTQDKKRDKEIN